MTRWSSPGTGAVVCSRTKSEKVGRVLSVSEPASVFGVYAGASKVESRSQNSTRFVAHMYVPSSLPPDELNQVSLL